MDTFSFGDYVVYDPGYTCEVGRFVSYGKDTSTSFVCFHEGCTAACTPTDMLYPYTGSLDNVSKSIGYHRFDEFCPDYDEECCYMCKARKQIE